MTSQRHGHCWNKDFMKTKMIGFVLLAVVSTALAIEPGDLDDRIRLLTEKFAMLQSQPDKAVPANVLAKARGIILLDRTKAGFIFAYQGGGGIAMVRDAANKWSPVSFLAANQASLGFQIGGEQNFYAILLMNTNALRVLTDPTFEFRGEARGTAGGSTSGVETSTPLDTSILVYDDRQGLFGGAAIKGGGITPDDQADQIYYGKPLTASDILFGHQVQRSEAARVLEQRIDDYAHHPSQQ